MESAYKDWGYRRVIVENKGWRTFQIIQFILFLCISAFLFIRTVDGHGTVQTLEVKLISFAVWAFFLLGCLSHRVVDLLYCPTRQEIKRYTDLPN